jgi:type IV pilus assembly protein PilY1
MDDVKSAVTTLIDQITDTGAKVGLMRYDSNASGGMVMQPIKPLDSSYASALKTTVNAFQPSGSTPLSETLYESYLYLKGGTVKYGNSSKICSLIINPNTDNAGNCTFNNYQLNSSITSTTSTSISVQSSTDLAVNDVILIDIERMRITAISGNTLTVTRGYDSTTAATHSQNATIKTLFLSSAITSTTNNTIRIQSPVNLIPGITFQIDSEQMTITAIDGSNIIVIRGANGTTAATHSNNTSITTTISYPSVASSRTNNLLTSNTYNTPLDDASVCAANNHIIYLTDGEPTSDTDANDEIQALTGSSCPTSSGGPAGNGSGNCLDKLAGYMHTHNLISGNISSVKSHFIGFGSDVTNQTDVNYLTAAATAGGGQFKTAGDIATLSSAFDSILAETVADTSATFVTPSVAVNSFNKTQILEDMYIAMFKPSTTTHWDGNLKKFKMRNVTEAGSTHLAVVGKNLTTGLADETTSAIDSATGFFKDSAYDFWQASTDLNEDLTTKGGAANLLPKPNGTSSRNVYTYIGSNTPNSSIALSSHSFTTGNNSITETLLGVSSGLTGSSCTSNSTPSCKNLLINWTRGDANGDGSSSQNDVRRSMGDPIHSQPAVVIYGNSSTATTTTDKLNDAIVFVLTNDGFLHAVDVLTGIEQWSFIPQEILPDLKNIYINNDTAAKHYSLDGDIRALKYDVNNNGMIDTADGDRVILYFSQGRGGPNYYALDVTDKTNPKFMWSLGSTLGKVTQSWSTPTIARVKINGPTQNSQKFVLIFGGGYDPSEETQGYISTGDTYGNAIYMVDAIRGTLLWSAGHSSDTSANLKLADMTHAIPSNVTTVDTDNDNFTDRLYVGDLAGQLWRIDITNGNSASSLATGGVIASLGAKGVSTPTNGDVTNNRTFFNAPDIAKILSSDGTGFYYNIGIGSGDRSMPKSNITTADRFYSIRDYNIDALTQSQFGSLTKIYDSDLTAISGSVEPDNMSTSGWKFLLSSTEKSLAQSSTLNGAVMFTTFIPGSSAIACQPTTGTSRSYAIKLTTGIKYFDNLYETFNTTGLPTQISSINATKIVRTDNTNSSSSSSAGSSGSSSSSSSSNSTGLSTGCLSGVSILNSCVEFGSKIKTYWREAGTN